LWFEEAMSEERRRRQQQRQAPERFWKSRLAERAFSLCIVVAVALAVYAALWKRNHRLDGFARCLAAKQVKMYGLFWCTHCADQKEMFAASFRYIPYVECGMKGSHGETPVCIAAGAKNFPTWQFAEGKKLEGAQTLKVLSEETGCRLP
jgi:hypothetical protein